MANYDWLVVGAGFTGAVLAERIASQLGQRVLVVDARNHVGGNAHDALDASGVLVHQYGPHVFHTSDEGVWNYLSRFTEWRPYVHRVLAHVDGQLVPVPFNLTTLHALVPGDASAMEARLLHTYGDGARVPVLQLLRSPDSLLRDVGALAYEKVFLHYTTKQWGLLPEELDPSVTARVPVVVSRDDRYFRDTYQAIPAAGYTALFDRLLDHPLITVAVSTPYESLGSAVRCRRMVYTGAIDGFFGHEHGALPYRSLAFQHKTFAMDSYQPVAQVNFPDQSPFTRVVEHKHFLNQQLPVTSLTWEVPQAHVPGVTEPYYPIPKDANRQLHDRYAAQAATLGQQVLFAGRLGDYRYYDMHQAVARAQALFRNTVVGEQAVPQQRRAAQRVAARGLGPRTS